MFRTASRLIRQQTSSSQNVFSLMNRNHDLILRPSLAAGRRDFSLSVNNRQDEQQQQQQTNGQQQQQEQQQKQEATPENKEVTELKEKLKTAEEKIKELDHKYKSALAEMQSVRRIAKTDVDNEKKFAISKFAQNLLDVADNFERAIQNTNEDDVKAMVDLLSEERVGADEELLKKARTLNAVFQGVKMTENILQRTFNNFGVEKMTDVVGSKFDPSFHDAVVTQPMKEGDDPAKANTVSHVLKTGYKLKDRVLRPAQVVVQTNE